MEAAPVVMEQILTTIGGFLPKVVGVLVLLFATVWVSKRAGKRVELSTGRKLEPTLARFFGSLVRYGILAIGVLGCLRIFGFETTSFAALIGAAGLAVGLALQGTLSNFSAGVMLILFRPFKVGDVVEVAGVTGKVAGISLFTSEFDTVDNKRVIVPNGGVFGSTITNYNHHDTRRVDFSVGTDYGADLKQARQVMLDAVSGLEGVLSEPAPQVYLKELGGSSIDWSVRVWVNTPDFWAVREAGVQSVKYALDKAGIGIPFPQLDVHLDKG